MNLLETTIERRSFRQFIDQEVPRQAVEMLVDALLWAPGTGNAGSSFSYSGSSGRMEGETARCSPGPSLRRDRTIVVVACLERRIAVRYLDPGVHLYAVRHGAGRIENLLLVARELGGNLLGGSVQ